MVYLLKMGGSFHGELLVITRCRCFHGRTAAQFEWSFTSDGGCSDEPLMRLQENRLNDDQYYINQWSPCAGENQGTHQMPICSRLSGIEMGGFSVFRRRAGLNSGWYPFYKQRSRLHPEGNVEFSLLLLLPVQSKIMKGLLILGISGSLLTSATVYQLHIFPLVFSIFTKFPGRKIIKMGHLVHKKTIHILPVRPQSQWPSRYLQGDGRIIGSQTSGGGSSRSWTWSDDEWISSHLVGNSGPQVLV